MTEGSNYSGRNGDDAGDTTKLLTCDDVAKIMGVTRNQVYTWGRVHGAPHYKIGKSIMFRLDRFKEWFEKHQTGEGIKGDDEENEKRVVIDLRETPEVWLYFLEHREAWNGDFGSLLNHLLVEAKKWEEISGLVDLLRQKQGPGPGGTV